MEIETEKRRPELKKLSTAPVHENIKAIKTIRDKIREIYSRSIREIESRD